MSRPGAKARLVLLSFTAAKRPLLIRKTNAEILTLRVRMTAVEDDDIEKDDVLRIAPTRYAQMQKSRPWKGALWCEY